MPQPRGTKPIGQDQDHSMPQSHGRAIPSRRRTASERFDLLLHNHAGAAEPLKIKAPPHRHNYWTIRRPSSSDDGRPRSDAMAAAATTQRHAAARNQQRNRGDHRRHHHSSTGVRRFLAVRPTRGRGLLSARRLLPIRRLLFARPDAHCHIVDSRGGRSSVRRGDLGIPSLNTFGGIPPDDRRSTDVVGIGLRRFDQGSADNLATEHIDAEGIGGQRLGRSAWGRIDAQFVQMDDKFLVRGREFGSGHGFGAVFVKRRRYVRTLIVPSAVFTCINRR